MERQKPERKERRPDRVLPLRFLRTREREGERRIRGHKNGKQNNRKSISAYLIEVDGDGNRSQPLFQPLVSLSSGQPLHPPQRSSLATPAARHLDESKKQNNSLFAIVEDEEEQRERGSASLPCLTMGTRRSVSSRKRGWLDQLTGLRCKKERIQTREKVWRERRVRGRKRAEERSRRWAGISKLCFYNPDPSCFENFSTALGQ